MKVLLVTYELKKPKETYTEFISVLKTAPHWWHYLENTWLLATNDSPKTWTNKLEYKFSPGDRLLIVEITQNYYGWLPKEAWAWITKHLGYRA